MTWGVSWDYKPKSERMNIVHMHRSHDDVWCFCLGLRAISDFKEAHWLMMSQKRHALTCDVTLFNRSIHTTLPSPDAWWMMKNVEFWLDTKILHHRRVLYGFHGNFSWGHSALWCAGYMHQPEYTIPFPIHFTIQAQSLDSPKLLRSPFFFPDKWSGSWFVYLQRASNVIWIYCPSITSFDIWCSVRGRSFCSSEMTINAIFVRRCQNCLSAGWPERSWMTGH